MILMKDIIREGHPTLEIVAKDVKVPLSKADKKTLKELLEFIKNSQNDELAERYELRPAIGIAAPQINISKRMFAIHVHDLDGKLYSYALVNPEIIRKGSSLIYLPGGEGCLSVDRETFGLTPRYDFVEVKALSYIVETDELISVHLVFEGYVGIVFQHEFDHINGIMFTTKLFPSLPAAKPAFELHPDVEEEPNF